MIIYSHRQTSPLIFIVGLVPVIATIGILANRDYGSKLPSLFIILLAFLVWQFSSLTVDVTDSRVKVGFGPGLFSRTIALGKIVDLKKVRNSWLLGWGIRLFPGGTMFNLAGLDAVELKLENGRLFRIGTDQPVELEAAIREALQLKQDLMKEAF